MPSPEDGQERRVGGRYRLSTLLGSGAMGTVWSGYDEVLQRRVAVKELKVPHGVPDQEALDMRERIMREARALGGLSHPNVITVFDVVDADGEPVVVLELLPSQLEPMTCERWMVLDGLPIARLRKFNHILQHAFAESGAVTVPSVSRFVGNETLP